MSLMFENDIKDSIKFLNKPWGVVLQKRGVHDNHICIVIIQEDDGFWFKSRSSCSSSYWIENLIQCLKSAIDWMQHHADPDPSGYGYVFRTEGSSIGPIEGYSAENDNETLIK